MLKVAIGSDHAGFSLKTKIIEYLNEQQIDVIDCGTMSTDSVDYPDFAKKVAESVSQSEVEKGILVCGSGIGVSIVANKVKGVRAALCMNAEMAELSRLHNDANILCLGERLVDSKDAINIVYTWLNTDFEGGRHQRRVDKIHETTGC